MEGLHPGDVAEALGVDVKLVYRAIQLGHVDARYSSTRRPWIYSDELDRLLAAQREGKLDAALRGEDA
jgi:hypothetical protein